MPNYRIAGEEFVDNVGQEARDNCVLNLMLVGA
jgi:hypothetical protein